VFKKGRISKTGFRNAILATLLRREKAKVANFGQTLAGKQPETIEFTQVQGNGNNFQGTT